MKCVNNGKLLDKLFGLGGLQIIKIDSGTLEMVLSHFPAALICWGIEPGPAVRGRW